MHKRRAVTALLSAVAVATGLTATSASAEPSGAVPVVNATSYLYDELNAATGWSTGATVDIVSRPFDPSGDHSQRTLHVHRTSQPTESLALPAGRVSVAGSIVVSANTQAAWFNIANDTSGTGDPAPAATDGLIVGASPDGWLTVDGQNAGGVRVFDTSTGGTVTSYGTPFTDATSWTELDLSAGPDGLVADDEQGHVAYMTYAAPGTWHALATGTSKPVICASATASLAGCASGTIVTSTPEVEFKLDSLVQIPLNGDTPTTTALPCTLTNQDAPRLLGTLTTGVPVLDDTAAVAADPCPNDRGRLISVPIGGGSLSTSTFQLASPPVLAIAQGKAVYADDAITATTPSTFSSVADASSTPTVIETSGHAPATARMDVLTVGRVVWQDDETSRFPIGRTAVSVDQSGVTTGLSKRLVAPGRLVGLQLRASGAETAYRPMSDRKIHLLGPVGPATLKGSLDALSGDRVLSGGTVIDLRNGKRTTPKLHGPGPGGTKPRVYDGALSGSTVVFLLNNGAVWAINLDTGKETKLRGPEMSAGKVVAAIGTVSVYGNEAGWTVSPALGKGPKQTAIRPVDASNDATALPSGLSPTIQVTSDGILTQTMTGDWQLRDDSGAVTEDLGSDIQDPHVNSSVVEFRRPDGTAMVAPLTTVTTHQPWSLGAPLAPKHFTLGKRWISYQPFSAALTSCVLSIRGHGHNVAHVPCRPAEMALGDAFVKWDGLHRHHKVRTGRYHWRLVAANSAGPVLSDHGNSTTITGTIRVRRAH